MDFCITLQITQIGWVFKSSVSGQRTKWDVKTIESPGELQVIINGDILSFKFWILVVLYRESQVSNECKTAFLHKIHSFQPRILALNIERILALKNERILALNKKNFFFYFRKKVKKLRSYVRFSVANDVKILDIINYENISLG